MLDEPTRGIDVGAKSEVHHLMGELARQGKSILMISSDLPEVLAMSDRVIVMREGRITGRFDRAEATQEKIMAAATGQTLSLTPSPGTPGEGWGEGLGSEIRNPKSEIRNEETLTLPSPGVPGEGSNSATAHHPVRLRKTGKSSNLLRFRELGIALFVVLTFIVAAIKQPRMLARNTLTNIMLYIPLIVVVAMGQMMVIISRNIDLSVGSILAFCRDRLVWHLRSRTRIFPGRSLRCWRRSLAR